MKNLQLILTNPCTQQWSDIEQPDGKYHCSKCQKNIIDLTSKSDAESGKLNILSLTWA